jgi:hypothetical protein
VLKTIPLLDELPSEDYEPSAQVAWFVADPIDNIKPELYQLWQCVSIEVDRVQFPDQLWIKVPVVVRNSLTNE